MFGGNDNESSDHNILCYTVDAPTSPTGLEIPNGCLLGLCIILFVQRRSAAIGVRLGNYLRIAISGTPAL